MRPEKSFKIADKEITIREISVREIRSFWQGMETEPSVGIDGIYNVLSNFFPTCIFGIKLEDLDDMAPSQIKQLYDAFMAVNAVFFEAARMIEGENPILVGLRETLQPLLIMRLAGFFPTDIQGPGTTDTPSS